MNLIKQQIQEICTYFSLQENLVDLRQYYIIKVLYKDLILSVSNDLIYVKEKENLFFTLKESSFLRKNKGGYIKLVVPSRILIYNYTKDNHFIDCSYMCLYFDKYLLVKLYKDEYVEYSEKLWDFYYLWLCEVKEDIIVKIIDLEESIIILKSIIKLMKIRNL